MNKEIKDFIKVMDDHFAHHEYGFEISKTGEVLREDEFFNIYEDFKHEVVEGL